jgi:LytS/YehU family sensor histidine kinase
MAIAWALAAIPMARQCALAEREGRALMGLIMLSLGISYATAWLAYAVHPFDRVYTRDTIVVELFLGAVPTHALAATMVSLVGSWTSSRRLREQAADREAVLHAHATRAELDALRERMQPHFVLNALNTVAALARRGDADAAGEAAADLGEILQFSLSSTDDRVAFDTERTIVERYIAIEQARLGTRLVVMWSVDPATRTCLIPALSWQPLVENAIRHHIAPRVHGGALTLWATRAAGIVEIGVESVVEVAPATDATPRRDTTGFGGLGVGTSTLERRLALLYGADGTLERSVSGGRSRAILRIPLGRDDAEDQEDQEAICS